MKRKSSELSTDVSLLCRYWLTRAEEEVEKNSHSEDNDELILSCRINISTNARARERERRKNNYLTRLITRRKISLDIEYLVEKRSEKIDWMSLGCPRRAKTSRSIVCAD